MIVTTFSVLLLFITRATAAAADCNQALGMQNGAIKNEAITASSWKDDDHKAQFARLKTRKAWCSGNETSPYLQISLSEVYKITGIATQGSLRDRQWVSEYKIYYTTTTSAWKVHQASNGKSIFQGNSNFGAALRNDFSIPIIANIIRIYPTETRFISKGPKRACLRVEIYGCKKQAPCPPPNRPANGQRYGSDFRHNKRVRFSCNYGYQIIGTSSATCNDGKWNSDPPVCKGICRDPGNPRNGRIVNSKRQYLEGDLVEFSCWNGFDLFGENKTYCRNRNWDAVRPNCRGRCRDPGVPQHSFVEQEKFRIKNEFRHGGGEIKYKCRAGYTMVGDATLQCNDGRWSSAVPQCKVPCSGPDVPRNGRVIGNDFTHGKTVSFECARGYKVVGASSVTCQNGNWSDSTPVCKASCTSPDDPPHGWKRGNDFSHGGRVRFGCDVGYQISGAQSVTCNNGTWDGQPPLCKASCSEPGDIVNGSKDGNDFRHGHSVVYNCSEDYVLQGQKRLTCIDGKWNSTPPTCSKACGKTRFLSKSNCRGRIIGGHNANRGAYPWQVLVKKHGRIACSASLLNDRWVLTVAHCVSTRNYTNGGAILVDPKVFKVYLGLHRVSKDKETQVQIRQVVQIQKHDNFEYNLFDSDLALLKLNREVDITPYVRPICLPVTNRQASLIKPNINGMLPGWGRTTIYSSVTDVLKAVCLPAVTRDVCQRAYLPENYNITENMLCAGHFLGGRDACDGDSGGGYVFQDRQTNTWVLGGVMSWGSEHGCGLAGKYGVYVKISNFIHWIYDKMV